MKPLYWRLGGVAAAVLLLIAAWFLLITPQRDKAAELDAAAQSQQDASQLLQTKIAVLKKQSEELPEQEAKLAAIQQRLPGSPAIPSLIRSLTKLAKSTSVHMSTLTPGTPAVITVEAPVAPVATAAPSDAESAPSEADAAAAAKPKVVAAPDVMAIPVSITACGSYAELRNYMSKLESMQRVMLVTGLNITKGDCSGSESKAANTDLTAAITADVFTLPNSNPTETAASTTGATQ